MLKSLSTRLFFLQSHIRTPRVILYTDNPSYRVITGGDFANVSRSELELALEVSLECLKIGTLDFDGEASLGWDHHLLDWPRDARARVNAAKLAPLVGSSHDRVPEEARQK